MDDNSLSEELKLALDPAVRSSWSEAAAPSVAAYSWEQLMPQFERVLRDVAEPASSQSL